MAQHSFFLEFTAEDRIRIEPRIRNNTDFHGLRIKYQTARKTEKVNYSATGFDPFFEYDWLTVIKYDNLKGDAVKDLMKPTPVTFSPHGLHVKESWGSMSAYDLLMRVVDDLATNWIDYRTKYDDTLPYPDNDKLYIADHNLKKIRKFLTFVFPFNSNEALEAYSQIFKDQSLIPIPEPQEDEWLLEQNSIAAHRVEKRAHRGEPDIVKIGNISVLTYQHADELNIQD